MQQMVTARGDSAAASKYRGAKMATAPSWPADKVERRAVAELVPAARNARTHTLEQVDQLVASIKEWGWTTPVLLDEAGGIIAGHGRVLAAKKLKIETIPCMVARGWTEAQKRAYVIADNKLAENAGWDEGLLRLELGELQALDFDLAPIGFSVVEIGNILGDEGRVEEPYSRNLEAPIYVPKGDAPPIAELFDDAKTKQLQAEIRAADLAADVAAFLLKAAERHTVFDFHRVADYYAAAPAPVQRLMERSALVIIDFNSAIENGFAKLTDRLEKLAATMPKATPDA